MIEHNAQQPGTNPAHVKSNKTQEGSELVEEADQPKQQLLVEVWATPRLDQIGHHWCCDFSRSS